MGIGKIQNSHIGTPLKHFILKALESSGQGFFQGGAGGAFAPPWLWLAPPWEF